MKTKEFLKCIDEARLQAAIAAAEGKTSGEIRVLISDRKVGEPVEAAQRAFLENGMDKTRERNAVLIFIAPQSQSFAVIGDEAVHRVCGQAFWDELGGLLKETFGHGHFTDGLVAVVVRTGDLLGKHFPRRGDDVNELPDRILGG
jgi:uncharacterized membrane protein